MTIFTINFHVESRADNGWLSLPCLRSVFHHFPLAVVMFLLYKCASAEDKVVPDSQKKSFFLLKNRKCLHIHEEYAKEQLKYGKQSVLEGNLPHCGF